MPRSHDYPYSAGFKESDGDTSAEAARAVDVFHGRRAVARVLTMFGPRTCDEIADILQVSPQVIRPRMSELKQIGVAYKTSACRFNRIKKRVRVFAVTEKFREFGWAAFEFDGSDRGRS